MTAEINYQNKTNTKTLENLILFTDEDSRVSHLKKYLSNSEFFYTKDLLKNSDLTKRILIFDTSSKKKLILISIKKNLKNSEVENLGAELFNKISSYKKNSKFFLISNTLVGKNEKFLGHFLHGFKLKSYDFKNTKLKTKQKMFL